MTEIFEPTLQLAKFKLPPQDIKVLSFCKSAKPLRVSAWVDELHLTQVRQTSAALYEAVPQIAHLQTDIKSRYDMLESLWSPAQLCAQSLAKEFLQQPLILPESALKTAILAQALQKHLADGYTLCVKELVQQKKLRATNQEMLLNCLFRAIYAIGQLLLRSYQLYSRPPPETWLRLHVLYQTAEYYDLHTQPVRLSVDADSPKTVQDAYLRLIMTDSIRPNQLSQLDIATAYAAIGSWASHVQLHPSATADDRNLYLIELNQDSGPVAKNRFTGNEFARVLEVNFQDLISKLGKLSGERESFAGFGAPVTRPTDLPDTLLEHILDCWTHSVQRALERRQTNIEADACIGLIDCHFHICGGLTFDQFINPQEAPETDSLLSDGFNSLINSMTSKKEIDPNRPARQTVFKLAIQNVSSGGYCAIWQGDLPSRVEAGEVIGIREQGRRAWSIGVVRWIRQLKNASQLGIQLLSSQPVPYGASVMYDLGGHSDYMRVIHIPSPTIAGQPPTLLTAQAPFQERSRVRLKQEESQFDIRLEDCVYSTSKVRLFAFDTLSSE